MALKGPTSALKVKGSTKHAVFKGRKEGIKKKAMELSILCDIPVCVFIQDPNGKFEMWPENAGKVRRILDQYNQKQRSKSQDKMILTRANTPNVSASCKNCMRVEEIEIPNEITMTVQKFDESQPNLLTQDPSQNPNWGYLDAANLDDSFWQDIDFSGMDDQSNWKLLPIDQEGLLIQDPIENPNKNYLDASSVDDSTCRMKEGNLQFLPSQEILDPIENPNVGNFLDEVAGPVDDPICQHLHSGGMNESNCQSLPSQETTLQTQKESPSKTPNCSDYLDASLMDDNFWLDLDSIDCEQPEASQETNFWSSILQEVGASSLAPVDMMQQCPPASAGLLEWKDLCVF